MAELLGVGIAKVLLGKAAVPDHLPFVTDSIGLLGIRPSRDLMQERGTPLMVESAFPYSAFRPKEAGCAACGSTSTTACWTSRSD
ncbi:MAG TPA: hypothetical protein VHK70_02090 [Burkholderiaceae bacterium]|jgi:pyruvate dehydrogenase (quinone)|nr:hypothetical protein [Burkholderiaceae bacterium]